MLYRNVIGVLFMLLVLLLSANIAIGQPNYQKTVLIGGDGLTAEFNDTNRPVLKRWLPFQTKINIFGMSSISDSATGKPLIFCDGRFLYDTLGHIIENGDHLVDSMHYYVHRSDNYSQNSIILPLGNRRFFVSIVNVTDSSYKHCWNDTLCKPVRTNCDDWRYNIVDMNLNNGAGKVVVKNEKLLYKNYLKVSNMMACRHANGRDWWLFKSANDSLTLLYRFLITKDSIYGPYTQNWDDANHYLFNSLGQMNFNVDGTKWVTVLWFANSVIVGDFDRCTGLLSNRKVYPIPYDSLLVDQQTDSVSMGIAFSPNNRFIYVSRYANIQQLDTDEPDSNLMWYLVKKGGDSTIPFHNYVAPYGNLYNGPDQRIYVGHRSTAPGLGMSVIDHPNLKGASCGWCNQCLASPGADSFRVINFSTQPNYSLGPTNNPNCWPVGLPAAPLIPDDEWLLYPNPAKAEITIHVKCKEEGWFRMYNMLGELVYEVAISKGEVDHRLSIPYSLPNGLYTYQCRYNKEGELKVGKVSVMR